MEMELGIGTNDVDASLIAKGKRTKRLRHLSPCAVTAAAISSSSSASEEENGSGRDYGSFSSTTTTTTFEGTDQEEEDMANCLILLAQGKRGGGGGEEENHNNKIRQKSSTTCHNNRRFSEMNTTANAAAATKIGFDVVYECKTCNRTFPSFQALGGHRASHKKPKLTPEDKKQQPQKQQLPTLPLIANCEFEETKQGLVVTGPPPPPLPLQLGCGGASNNINRGLFHGGNKAKVHECSICGSEFTSGQALGGHMRRHRATSNISQVMDIETSCDKPRNVLELDLNLPAAPEDDHRDFLFTAATQKSMVLSATPLVGCHY